MAKDVKVEEVNSKDLRQDGNPVRVVENLEGPVSEAKAREVNGYPGKKTVTEEKRDRLKKKGYDLDEGTDTGADKANV